MEVSRFIGKANFPKIRNPPAGGNYFSNNSVKNVFEIFVKGLTLTGAGRSAVDKELLWGKSGPSQKLVLRKTDPPPRGEERSGKIQNAGITRTIKFASPPISGGPLPADILLGVAPRGRSRGFPDPSPRLTVRINGSPHGGGGVPRRCPKE